jgi:hypothetical protein
MVTNDHFICYIVRDCEGLLEKKMLEKCWFVINEEN